MTNAEEVIRKVKAKASKEKSLVLRRFFKCGVGEYGEGDVFLGVTVPELRRISKEAGLLPLSQIRILMQNQIHEIRLIGLYFLVALYNASETKEKVIEFYLKEKKAVNNWDLVDSSASYILGDFLLTHKKEQKVLSKLIESKNLWDRRIGILATFSFIKKGNLDLPISLYQNLLSDKEPLIQKAIGWMLREVGKKSEKTLTDFLENNISSISRTSLRYAIERLSNKQKDYFLKK